MPPKLIAVCLAFWIISAAAALPQSANRSSKATAPANGKPVGKVQTVKGKAYRLDGNQKIYLKPGQDVSSDWKLNCEAEGYVVLLFEDGSKQKVTARAVPYIVPRIVKDVGVFTSTRGDAGRTRTNSEPIFSPPQGEAGGIGCVWPAKCVFRWEPFLKEEALTITLRSTVRGSDVIWSKVVKENGNGIGDYQDARDAMTAFVKVHPDVDLEFTLTPENGESHSVQFSLLDQKSEFALEAALSDIHSRCSSIEMNDHRTRSQNEWGDAARENSIITHIWLASVFQRNRLFTEAAEEMDDALAIAPQRDDLWRGAVWANRRSGNALREKYLLKHPPAGYRD